MNFKNLHGIVPALNLWGGSSVRVDFCSVRVEIYRSCKNSMLAPR